MGSSNNYNKLETKNDDTLQCTIIAQRAMDLRVVATSELQSTLSCTTPWNITTSPEHYHLKPATITIPSTFLQLPICIQFCATS